jgi:hypothetical protein
MRRKFVVYLLISGTLLLALFAMERNSRVRADEGNGNIVGTWINTATVNTPPGAPPFVFTELATFNLGGTFLDTFALDHDSANPFVPPPLAVDFSDKLGTWKQVGDSNQFAVTFKEFLFAGPDTPTAVYGPILFPGQNVGMATVEAVVTLHTGAGGDTLTGPFTFQLTNLQGTVLFAGSGTVSATRLQIQPLATP